MSRTDSNVITVWLAADDERVTGFGTSAARTQSDVARSRCGCKTLTVFAHNGAAVPYAGFTRPAVPDISMRGTGGSIRLVILDIRGWKEAESRPRSWR